jgi:hypothetical protein
LSTDTHKMVGTPHKLLLFYVWCTSVVWQGIPSNKQSLSAEHDTSTPHHTKATCLASHMPQASTLGAKCPQGK